MRDGSTRRRHTSESPTNGNHPIVQLARWRDDDRVEDVRALAVSARGLTWSRALLDALLEELHVSEEFDALVGRMARLPRSQYPRLVAIALLLRHSWDPADLERIGTRLGLRPVTSAPSGSTTRVRRSQGRVRTERRFSC
jgi:hypothetical protein